jgi:hypothetical protein
MSLYWNNKFILDRLKKLNKVRYKLKLNTDIGRFYFYFQKDDDTQMSGKVIFFPNKDFDTS